MDTSSDWQRIAQITDDDATDPTVGIQLLRKRSQGQNEFEIETDVYVAWHAKNDHQDQVNALAFRTDFEETTSPAQSVSPQYLGQNQLRLGGASLSDTFGYAAKPELSVTNIGANLAWMDDGVFQDDGLSRIYVMGNFGNYNFPATSYVLYELWENDASGAGISKTGGSMSSLSMSAVRDDVTSTEPYVAWTESRVTSANQMSQSPTDGVYLRVNQFGIQVSDDTYLTDKETVARGNSLENDLDRFGESTPQMVQFDGRDLDGKTLQFISELGARVTVQPDGQVEYDPRNSSILSQLSARGIRSEQFVYRVDDGINQSEGLVNFVIKGVNRWHNLRNEFDVNGDGNVTPLDVLLIINDINTNGSRGLSGSLSGLQQFIDVNDDGSLSPLDVLMIINYLNSRPANGESEPILAGDNFDLSLIYALSWGELSIEVIRKKRIGR